MNCESGVGVSICGSGRVWCIDDTRIRHPVDYKPAAAELLPSAAYPADSCKVRPKSTKIRIYQSTEYTTQQQPKCKIMIFQAKKKCEI